MMSPHWVPNSLEKVFKISARVYWLFLEMTTKGQMKSFQTRINWMIASVARIGRESGIMIRQKIVKWLAPSIRAASINSPGTEAKKVRSTKIAKIEPNDM